MRGEFSISFSTTPFGSTPNILALSEGSGPTPHKAPSPPRLQDLKSQPPGQPTQRESLGPHLSFTLRPPPTTPYTHASLQGLAPQPFPWQTRVGKAKRAP